MISSNQYEFGVRGLYNGESLEDIYQRKGIRPDEDIMNYMSDEELGGFLFMITQALEAIKNRGITEEHEKLEVFYDVGREVRKHMINNPETLPVVDRSKLKADEYQEYEDISEEDLNEWGIL